MEICGHPDRIHFRGFEPKWRDLIGNTRVVDQGLTGFGCPFPDSSDHGKWSDEGPSSYDSPSSDESKGLELRNCGLIGISCLSGTIQESPITKSPNTSGIPLFLYPAFARFS
jgi:hypothetical protein